LLFLIKIQGVEEIPAIIPYKSPIDLVIANPGNYLFLSHTLNGPIY